MRSLLAKVIATIEVKKSDAVEQWSLEENKQLRKLALDINSLPSVGLIIVHALDKAALKKT